MSHGVVVHDLVEARSAELLLAAGAEAANHLDGPTGDEPADLALPLVLGDVGQTINTGATPAWVAMISAAAIAWTVLPSPISSARRQRPARQAKSAPSRW